ncbi:MAG: zinc-binding dehydrogenase [Alphaproteobacteria bacterium]|nr:zinc-binding dehydrogenase [Alphaproteobacteria bacterium]
MKSWWMVAGAAGPELQLRETPAPMAGPGQLLVQVHAASLNRGEFITGQGLLGQLSQPKAMGMEAAGTIVSMGPGVTGWQVGQRVMGRALGGFAEQALLVAAEAMPMPDHFEWVHGASLPITYMVSHDMLVAQGELAAGEWLLLNGAASGVGTASLQLAQMIGAHTIGTSGQAHKLDALRAQGLEVGVLTRGGGFREEVMRCTGGKGVNLAINPVGASILAEQIESLAYRGRLAIVGYVDGQFCGPLDIGAVHAQRLLIFGVSNKNRMPAERTASVADFTQRFLPIMAQRKWVPLIDRVFAFDQLPAAREHMQADRHIGKVVLQIA